LIKTLCRYYLHCIANLSATVLNIFSKEIISNNTKYRKQILNIKHLKVLVKWHWWWNFTCVCTFNFALFSRVTMGNCFWCYFRQLFISLAFGKCKKYCNILIINLVKVFCPLFCFSAKTRGVFVLFGDCWRPSIRLISYKLPRNI